MYAKEQAWMFVLNATERRDLMLKYARNVMVGVWLNAMPAVAEASSIEVSFPTILSNHKGV